MRLPRMTTRRWMIVVAVVGLLMGGTVRLKQRRDRFLARAEYHAKLEYLYRTMGSDVINFLEERVDPQQRTKLACLRARLPDEITYQGPMACKFRHAARYPCLPLEPEPHEPD
jgi:hypothetical protein